MSNGAKAVESSEGTRRLINIGILFLTIAVDSHALYNQVLPQAVRVIQPVFGSWLLQPFTKYYEKSISSIPFICVLAGLIVFVITRLYGQQSARESNRFYGFAALLLLALPFGIQSLWTRNHYDPNRVVVIVNSGSGGASEDAREFWRMLDEKVKKLEEVTTNHFPWEVWFREDPYSLNGYEQALEEIKDNANLERVLWINYFEDEPQDRIEFFRYAHEFEPWTRKNIPMLEPSGLYDDYQPLSTQEVLTQTVAAIYLQAAIMYHKEMPSESWNILTKVWEAAKTSPYELAASDVLNEVDYLKRDPTYFYLLALLTAWAENHPSEGITQNHLIIARRHLEEGKAYIQSLLDSGESSVDDYYRLYLLQVFYTLNDIQSIENHFALISEEQTCDAIETLNSSESADDEETPPNENRTRIKALLQLKVKILLDFPHLLERFGESPEEQQERIERFVTQLRMCDENDAESNLLSTRISMDLPRGDSNQWQEVWPLLRQVLGPDLDNTEARQQLYWLCTNNPDDCPPEISETVAQWTGVWGIDIGEDKRVFRLGTGWGSNNSMYPIPLGTQQLQARRESNSVMHVQMLDPAGTLSWAEDDVRADINCGGTLNQRQDVPVSFSQDRTFDVLFGDAILKHYADTFLQVNRQGRKLQAVCNATIDVTNDVIEPSHIKRNIWIVAKPGVAIGYEDRRDGNIVVDVRVVVTFDSSVNEEGAIEFTNPSPGPESNGSDVVVRVCALPMLEGQGSPSSAPSLDSTPPCPERVRLVRWAENANHVEVRLPRPAGSDHHWIIAEVFYTGDGEPALLLRNRRSYVPPQ